MLSTSVRLLTIIVMCACLSGCYVLQVAGGQMELMSKRRPIGKMLVDPATPAPLRARLEYVTAARDFASRELGLPDNASYRSYADLDRPYAVWNVFATPEFSVEPRRWCFPVAGCVVYRGYFDVERARAYARRMRARGQDAAVGGVSAYSTLGHFDDPVLSTMLGWSDVQLAGTLFHELAHQVVYVPGDSEFNEAFATIVEETGLERWLQTNGRRHELDGWRLQRSRQGQFVGLLLRTRDRLQQLYASSLPAGTLRARKQEEFGRLKFEYWRLKADWNGYAGYDAWFDRALNNAHLVSAATYHGCVPGLQQRLNAIQGDLQRFYEEARRLARLSLPERQRQVCGDREQDERYASP